MLAYVLAWVVGLGSLGIYLAAFFFPEIHRKNDFIWSGIGLFYALVLWVYAKRVTGGLLLGQTASVSLLCWFGWQTLTLRRQLTPLEQQTQLPGGETVGAKLTGLKSSLQQQLTKLPRPRPKSAPATTAPVTSPIQSSESPAETLVEAPEAGIEETTEAADDVVVEAMNEAIAPPEPVELEETEPAVAEVTPLTEEAIEVEVTPTDIPEVPEVPEADQTKPKVIIQPRRQPKLPNLPPIPVDLSNLQEQASKLVANTKEKVQSLLKSIPKPQTKSAAPQSTSSAGAAELESKQASPSAPAPETVTDALETEESLMSPSAEVLETPPEATADLEEAATESLVVDSDAAIAEVAETEVSIAEVAEEMPEEVVEAQVTESIPNQALDQDQTDIPTLNPEPVAEASPSIEEVAPEADLAPPAESVAAREAVSPDLTLVGEESLESTPSPVPEEASKAEPEAPEETQEQDHPQLVRPSPPAPDLVDRAGGSPSQEVKPTPEQQPGTEASESPAKPDPSDHSTESP